MNASLNRLLAILQSIVVGKSLDMQVFADMTESDWEELYNLAVAEGVMAVCFAPLLQCAASTMPRRLKLQWAASADSVAQRYRKISAVAAELERVFADNGIKLLIFKGIKLSKFYPVPESREFGDLDIFTFDINASNRLLLSLGAVRQTPSPKHIVFSYKGVLIENHCEFLNVSLAKGFRFLNEVLREEVSHDGGALFTALHFMAHGLQHYAVGLRWRYLFDWALLLRGLNGALDHAQYDSLISQADFKRLSDAMTAIAVHHLGLPTEAAPPFVYEVALTEEIMADMAVTPQLPESERTFAVKCRQFIQRRRRYSLIGQGVMLRGFALSVYTRIWRLFHR